MHVLVLYHRCLNMLLCVFGDVQGVTLSAGANTCLGALPQVSVHAAVCVWGCAGRDFICRRKCMSWCFTTGVRTCCCVCLGMCRA